MDPDVVKKTNSLQSVYLTQVLTNNPENVLLRDHGLNITSFLLIIYIIELICKKLIYKYNEIYI